MLTATAALMARLFLAAIFLVAGVPKLVDRAGFRKALINFGVPAWLAKPCGILLPLAEIAVAAGFLSAGLAWFASLAALVLLCAFILGISVNLARGRTPECHCFGQLHSAPAGWSTVGRNAALACAAAFLAWDQRVHPPLSLVRWFAGMTIAHRADLLVCCLFLGFLGGQTILLMQILRQQGRILLRLDALEARPSAAIAEPRTAMPKPGLPPGSPAPDFRLSGIRGETIALHDLVAKGKPVLLLFTNPNCGPCQALLPEAAGWYREHSAALTIALVSEGTVAENRSKSGAQFAGPVLVQRKREVAEAYQAWGTPTAVLVGPNGTIRSPSAQGVEAIRALVAQSLNGYFDRGGPAAAAHAGNGNGYAPRLPAALHPGSPCPPLELHDIDGKPFDISALRGHPTLLLFWNPGCGFCQRMLGDLQEWDASRPADAPNLVVLSTGTDVDSRGMGLRSPVLLDAAGRAASALGAHGTPMAVLLDAEGCIASHVAAGAQAIFDLVTTETADSFALTPRRSPLRPSSST
jgi:thiol-disulfide isomerase/thioredoxin/uncharacterized membrane protein YphA (DoxX/SURF4 family)